MSSIKSQRRINRESGVYQINKTGDFMGYISEFWQTQPIYFKIAVLVFVLCVLVAAVWLLVRKLRKNRNYTLPIESDDISIKSLNKDKSYPYDSMDGNEFQEFCAEILRQNGYINVETKKSRDYGADILAEKDDVTYAIQCKRYGDDVSNDAVQEAHTAKDFYMRHVSVVITNRYFRKSAVKTAAATRTILWDRIKLNELIGRTGMKINELVKLSKSRQKKVLSVKKEESING
jgi:restriction system protein